MPINVNPELPTIAFSEDADMDSFHALMHFANLGLGGAPGWMFEFVLADGTTISGEYHSAAGRIGHQTGIRLETGEVVFIDTDQIKRAVFL